MALKYTALLVPLLVVACAVSAAVAGMSRTVSRGPLGVTFTARKPEAELCRTLGIFSQFQMMQGETNPLYKKCSKRFLELMEEGLKEVSMTTVTRHYGAASTQEEKENYFDESIEIIELFHEKGVFDNPQALRCLLACSSLVDSKVDFLASALRFAPAVWWEQFAKEENLRADFRMTSVAEEVVTRIRYRATLPLYLHWATQTKRTCRESTVMAILKFDAERKVPFESKDCFTEMFNLLCDDVERRSAWRPLAVTEVLRNEVAKEAPLRDVQVLLAHTAAGFRSFMAAVKEWREHVPSAYSVDVLLKELLECSSDEKCLGDTLQLFDDALNMELHPRTLRRVMAQLVVHNISRTKFMEFMALLRKHYVKFNYAEYVEDLEYVLINSFFINSDLNGSNPQTTLDNNLRKIVLYQLKNTQNIEKLRKVLDMTASINMSLAEYNEFVTFIKTTNLNQITDILEMFSNLKAGRWRTGTAVVNGVWKTLRETKPDLDLAALARVARSSEVDAARALYAFFNENSVRSCSAEVVSSVARYDAARESVLTAGDFKALYSLACTPAPDAAPSGTSGPSGIIDEETASGSAESTLTLVKRLQEYRESLDPTADKYTTKCRDLMLL